MIAFDSRNFSTPSLAEQAVNMQPGLLKRHFTHRLRGFASICLTEIDQAFIVWGALTLVIFSLGQFSTMNWTTQTILDAALTGAGIAVTSGLTWAISSSAKLRWVVFLWAGLMSAGSVATAYGIFYSSALILSNLCLLWLGLCAVGYGAMAIGMQSRCFTAACWVHLAAVPALSYASSCQFFTSGLVMALTLFFFSIVPWDMQASNDSE
ncbi:MAG: hypothetical protein ACFB0D_09845 [Phormidesmis sp.]